MTLIAGKRGIQKCIHNLQSKSRTYHASSHSKDIGIIMKSGSLGCKAVRTKCCTDSLKLVCRDGNSDSCTTDQNTILTFTVYNSLGNFFP